MAQNKIKIKPVIIKIFGILFSLDERKISLFLDLGVSVSNFEFKKELSEASPKTSFSKPASSDDNST